jgi:3-methyl-2-oxobutanoate hydroxymethyltransferase
MLHHTRAVSRAVKSSYLISDLPFSSYESSPEQAFDSACRLIQNGNAEAVKLEGGSEFSQTIEKLTKIGVPVMGHVGLMPQRANSLGGFRVQGNTAEKVIFSNLLENKILLERGK